MSLRALLEGEAGHGPGCARAGIRGGPRRRGRYYLARSWARLGDVQRALREFRRVVDGGFHATFARDPWLDALRRSDEFEHLVARAKAGSDLARATFVSAGGPEAFDT